MRLALLHALLVTTWLAVGPMSPSAAAAAGARPGAGEGPPPAEAAALSATSAKLTIDVRNAAGQLIPARAKVIGADGRSYPLAPDSALMSHSGAGGYFYVNGRAKLSLPIGLVTLTLSRGFEYVPVTKVFVLNRDSTARVTLPRFVTLSARGWYGGDLHSHSRHEQPDYYPTPAQVKVVAGAEGLAVLHLLDNGWQFTGTPHALSDTTTVLYYSYEYRNQTCGHVGLPGLRSPVGTSCCLSPEPPYPSILDLSAQVHGQGGPLTVLAHPHSTDDYDLLSAWPGAGLGRELPVLAALGGVDAFDLASYSNEPDLDTAGWFDLLSAGLALPPSAGTDAELDRYSHGPPGGWRVYARQSGAVSLGYDAWLAALAAGRSFVTSFPLVPEFTIGGRGMGEALEVAGDSLLAPVHVEASCAIGLRGLALVADGREIWSRTFAASPERTTLDTTFQLRVPRPGWVVLRVDGPATHAALAAPPAVAWTNAVRILHGGAPQRSPAAMGRLLDSVDRFEDLAVAGGAWPVPWQRDTVLARIQRARQFFAQPFTTPPAAFVMRSPLPDATSVSDLVRQAAADLDDGDRVTYTVRVTEDSTMTGGWCPQTADTTVPRIQLAPGRWYWWSVEATDRAGNVVRSLPERAHFYFDGILDAPVTHREERPRALPNPSRGAVRLEGLGPDVWVYDLAGRRVAGPGHGVGWSAGTPVWDGNAGGRPAPPGIYLARGARSQRLVRIVRLR
jgi:hypothetical protein